MKFAKKYVNQTQQKGEHKTNKQLYEVVEKRIICIHQKLTEYDDGRFIYRQQKKIIIFV